MHIIFGRCQFWVNWLDRNVNKLWQGGNDSANAAICVPKCYLYLLYVIFTYFMRLERKRSNQPNTESKLTAWKVFKYGIFSGLFFPVFGLNTDIYSVNLHIQSEYFLYIRTRKNSVFGHFSRCDCHWLWLIKSLKSTESALLKKDKTLTDELSEKWSKMKRSISITTNFTLWSPPLVVHR